MTTLRARTPHVKGLVSEAAEALLTANALTWVGPLVDPFKDVQSTKRMLGGRSQTRTHVEILSGPGLLEFIDGNVGDGSTVRESEEVRHFLREHPELKDAVDSYVAGHADIAERQRALIGSLVEKAGVKPDVAARRVEAFVAKADKHAGDNGDIPPNSKDFAKRELATLIPPSKVVAKISQTVAHATARVHRHRAPS